MKCFNSSVLYIVLLFLFSGCGTFQITKKVKQGNLDLSTWDFEQDGAIALDGTWEFYWNKLLTSADFQNDTAISRKQFLEVPGVWNSLQVNGENLSGQGFGTYRAQIKLNKSYKSLSFKLIDAATSYKVWVNTVPVASNGNVSAIEDEMKPQLLPQVCNFELDTDRMEIVIQVANNFHHKGGLWESIRLGTNEQMLREREKSIIMTMFLVGTLFILFIYHFWIFFLRKTEFAAFWFGLTCFFVLIRSLTINDRLVYSVLQNFNVNIGYRIEYITIFILPLFLSYYLFYLFERIFSKIFLRIIIVITCIEVLLVLFTNSRFFTSLVVIFQLIMYLEFLCFFIVTFIQLKHQRHGAVLLILSWTVVLVCGMNDILYLNLLINTGIIAHYGFFIFLLTQAYILSDKIAAAHNTIEKLSLELSTVNVTLELKVAGRMHELEEAKRKSDDLLLNILPAETAEELKQKGHATVRTYGMVTVMFTDFKDFTQISEKVTPELLVAEIDYCFQAFDAIIENHGIEKIKTVGDAYMCAAGLPVPSYNHAEDAVNAAIEINAFMQQRKKEKEARHEIPFEARIGLHTGSVVAGVVGARKFSYDIWGDTVNTAARMEQNSEAGKINISGITYELVKDKFDCTYRGKIEAKNKGMIDMYFVS